MCGILGVLNLQGRPVSLDEIECMCSAIIHRGPDDGGFYIGPNIGFGMRRLSIIDLKTGQQPVHNEDQTVWVVFNGEIYNFRQLRKDLERQGHCFYTDSDTEVLVHLYEEYGKKCVDRLRGMFAFALWDDRRKILLLARDRMGKKPLYYARCRGRFLFGSELKSLLQLPDVPRALNWRSVNYLFTFLTTPPTESIVEGISKLPPGHILTVSAQGEVQTERYWTCDFTPDYSHNEYYFVEKLRELLEESVRLRMVSDVPVGAFLSGGIDSSAIVAMMSRLSPGRVKTFSIGFAEEEYNELPFARLAADTFHTEHHDLIIEPDIVPVIEDLAWYLDEPLGDSSVIPTYMVSKLASEHVTVLLSGDGGDEIFGGYDKYVKSEAEQSRSIPAPIRFMLRLFANGMPEGAFGRHFLQHASLKEPERYLDGSTLFRADEKQKLFQREVLELMSGYNPWQGGLELLGKRTGSWLSAIQNLDLDCSLPLDILTKVDRMSMAHSIETRAPLLDHKLVEFAATIPPDLKLRGTETKVLFKRAMRGLVPDEIIDRPKRGFAIPLGRWFRGGLSTFVRDLLLSAKSRSRGIFDPKYIESLLAFHDKGRELDLHIWTLISFELWCRTFLDRQPVPPVPRRRPMRESLFALKAQGITDQAGGIRMPQM
jgi:asparagine synthase (glutamine-hydrolysing)